MTAVKNLNNSESSLAGSTEKRALTREQNNKIDDFKYLNKSPESCNVSTRNRGGSSTPLPHPPRLHVVPLTRYHYRNRRAPSIFPPYLNNNHSKLAESLSIFISNKQLFVLRAPPCPPRPPRASPRHPVNIHIPSSPGHAFKKTHSRGKVLNFQNRISLI